MRKYIIAAKLSWIELEEYVNKLIDEGYLPVGGVNYCDNRKGSAVYMQAMIEKNEITNQ